MVQVKCLTCKTITTNAKFCSRSCAAKFNNVGIDRHHSKRSKEKSICKQCSKQLTNRQSKFCSCYCDVLYKNNKRLLSYIELFQNGLLKERKKLYIVIKEMKGNYCSVCKIEEWNGKPLRFWVDHQDGNASNNHPDNCRLICPNCDSQTDTFGGKNIGNGRKSRGMNPYGSI